TLFPYTTLFRSHTHTLTHTYTYTHTQTSEVAYIAHLSHTLTSLSPSLSLTHTHTHTYTHTHNNNHHTSHGIFLSCFACASPRMEGDEATATEITPVLKYSKTLPLIFDVILNPL